jgi:hypothetical protein
MLESYLTLKNTFDESLQTAVPGPDSVWRQQELLYRIEVLETCRMFAKTAPKGTDTKALLPHYHMADAYFWSLTLERRYGVGAGPDAENRRETAHNSLLRVIADYRKRFGSYAPTSGEQYQKDILGVIGAVIPVWTQYRNTYIEIK